MLCSYCLCSYETRISIWYHLLHTKILVLFILDMKTTKKFCLLSHCYEGDYVLYIHGENDVKCTSEEDIHAKHHNT